MKWFTPELANLIAFITTVTALVLIAKIGSGSGGVDLAVMTGLVAVLGSLAINFRKSQPVGVENAENVDQRTGEK